MNYFSAAIAAAALSAGVAHAEVLAPAEVSYDYGAVSQSLTGTPGDPESGKILMNKGAGNCVACHQVSELTQYDFQGTVGPVLDGVADRWEEADLRGIVSNAKEMFPGTIMPSFYKSSGYIRPGNAYTNKPAEEPLDPLLTAQQVEDLVAYLMTLKE